MQVVITDYTFPDYSVESSILEQAGHTIVASKDKKPAAELIPLVASADAVITQFAPVNADVIAAMQKARVIVRYGIGVDNVDLEAARQSRIPVCNIPDYCIDEVADHTLAFLLGVTRQVVANSNFVHSGKWGLATPLDNLKALKQMTVGVVGFGRIGREVVHRLLAFKAKVMVYDPVIPADQIRAMGAEPVTLRELLSQSDAITLHCPSTAETRGMLNSDSLAKTKPGVVIVNLARGDLVDPTALTESLQSGHVSAAALDVFSPEPIPADHPILKMDNVILASHIASASVPAVKKLRETTARLALMALQGEKLPNVVNGL